MALIGRIFVVLFAYLMACLAAASVVTFGFLPSEWSEATDSPDYFQGVGAVAAFTALVIAGYLLLPAMLVAAIAEGLRLRSVLLYAIVGGVAGLLSWYGAGLGGLSDLGLALPREAEIVAAAGIAAGFVYWALAGRNAGRWRQEPAVTGTSRP